MRLAPLTFASVLALGVGTAHAVPTFQITGGFDEATPSAPDNAIIPDTDGFFNDDGFGDPSPLTVSVTDDAVITYEFIGKEADFTDQFITPFGTIFNTDTVGKTVGGSIAAGDLDFSFVSPLGAGGGTTIDNGDGAKTVTVGSSTENVGFFASTEFDGDPSTLLLAFDDGGANSDDNHDDIVIEASLTEVPEPATLALLGGGLAGIGLAARRRRRA